MAKKKTTSTLIENSITLHGVFKPNVKTIFTIEDESEKGSNLYLPLTNLCGKKSVISFTSENGSAKSSKVLALDVPTNLIEEEVKAFILDEINKTL